MPTRSPVHTNRPDMELEGEPCEQDRISVAAPQFASWTGGILDHLQSRFETDGATEDAQAHLDGRLEALAVHTMLVESSSGGVDLEVLVREELRAFQFGYAPGIVINGGTVRLKADSARIIGLALHELTTNSIKFGALSREGGDWGVSIIWRTSDQMLHLMWYEERVPVLVSASERRMGFGRAYIEDSLPMHLGAITHFSLLPGGVHCSITVPRAHLEE